jgi:hypothetical protein
LLQYQKAKGLTAVDSRWIIGSTWKQRVDMRGVSVKMSVKIALALAAVALVGGAVVLNKNYDKWFTFADGRKFISDKLRDPESAQFRNERIGAGGALCGEVNSKNGSGGYSGFTRFISVDSDTVYLEGEGPLFKATTSEIIKLLDHKTEVLEKYIALRAREPDIPKPSDSQIDSEARSAYFAALWKERCE